MGRLRNNLPVCNHGQLKCRYLAALWGVLLLWGLAPETGRAQEAPATPQTPSVPQAPPVRTPAPPLPSLERSPELVPTETKGKDLSDSPSDSPDRSDKPEPPQTVKTLVKDFKTARGIYLAQQKEFRRQLREASEEQREAIREKLRENLATWLELQQTRVQELKEQIRDTKEAVKDYDRVVDAAEEKRRRP